MSFIIQLSYIYSSALISSGRSFRLSGSSRVPPDSHTVMRVELVLRLQCNMSEMCLLL